MFDKELSLSEIELLAGLGGIRSFATGSLPVPPVVEIRPAQNITDSNASLVYELVSYDGAQPEIILYWGSFDHGANPGLWDHSHSLGIQPSGVGIFDIGGYQAGETIFYQVQAKGSAYSDWADKVVNLELSPCPQSHLLHQAIRLKTLLLFKGRFWAMAASLQLFLYLLHSFLAI